MKPLGAVTRGLIAGAAGTFAMDLLWFRRYRRGGGESGFLEWEFSSVPHDWDQAPTPAQVGKRLVEGVFQRELPPELAPVTNNVVHWAYGVLAGAQYGLLAGSSHSPKLLYGLVFGPAVWATSYAVLPLAKLYQPVWDYDAQTLAKDLSAHVVYGLAAAAAFRVLAGKRSKR